MGEFLRQFQDWLVQGPAKLLARLTLRKIIISAGILLLVIAMAQAAIPADIAFVFAGDAMTYFEIAAAVYLLAARGQIRAALNAMRHRIISMRPWAVLRRGFSRARRIAGHMLKPPKASDEDGVTWAFA